eukprot:GILJ01018993.1.p1 GENE.GILJ01018993.1~~GILJ01018993.1.p1  ORF type:complete len:226 (-),score=28.36 GILJ01018993.1:110-787(-)
MKPSLVCFGLLACLLATTCLEVAAKDTKQLTSSTEMKTAAVVAKSRRHKMRSATKAKSYVHGVGFENGELFDINISASSQWDDNHAAKFGRLRRQDGPVGSWCAKENNQNQYLQADLGSIWSIVRVETQGRPTWQQWVTQYKLSVSSDCQNFVTIQKNNQDQLFMGNTDQNTVVTNTIKPPAVNVRCVRIIPTQWFGHISMRAEILGYQGSCVPCEVSDSGACCV